MAITTFIPELWSARLLYHLDKSHVASAFVNKNYEGEIRLGNKIHINTLSNITIGSYTKNTDMSAAQVLTTTDQTLDITEADYFNFQLDDIDKVQAAGTLMDEAMMRAAYGLNDKYDSFIFTTMATAVPSANQITAGTDIYSDIVDMAKVLDKANVVREGRKIAVTPDTYAALVKDSHFVANTDVNAEAARTGYVGMAACFEVFMTNNLPSTAKAIATCDMFTTAAEQISEVEGYRPELRFADAVKGLHVYGAKVTNANGLALLK